METLESIAVEISGADDMTCPFPHSPIIHDRKNKIPPEVRNSGGVLGKSLEGESHRNVTVQINPPYSISISPKRTIEKVGYSAHHLIPGNEMWNGKGHPLHAWIHEKVSGGKIKGDIGYVNNDAFNGVDLPSQYLVNGWTELEAKPGVQEGYANAAMTAVGGRQFHDAHKAYSDMVWNALEKISAKLDLFVKTKGCANKHCSSTREEPYDPPYKVVIQLQGVTGRLRRMVTGAPSTWKEPVMTSRFALIYKSGGMSQEEARARLAAMRVEMGSPTDV